MSAQEMMGGECESGMCGCRWSVTESVWGMQGCFRKNRATQAWGGNYKVLQAFPNDLSPEVEQILNYPCISIVYGDSL